MMLAKTCVALRRFNINITEEQLRFLACLALFLYASTNMMAGNKGILSFVGIQSELSTADSRLSKLSQEQSLMQHRVARLRSNSVDPDMADEQARLLLSYAEPDELVFLLNSDGTIPQMDMRQAALSSSTETLQ